MKKIVISQPAIGRYRKGFIDEIIKLNNEDYKIIIFASKVANTGAKSMEKLPKEIDYNLVKHTSILNLFFWQSIIVKVLKLRLNKNDKFVFCGNPRYLSNMLLAFWLKYRGVDCIWWGHGWSSTSSRLGSFIRFKLMNFFRIILYTDNEVKLLKKHIKNNMCALNNGLDVKNIRTGYEFNHIKYNYDILQIAFIGRITEKSDFDLLINALCEISPIERDRIKLTVVGEITRSEINRIHSKAKYLDINLYGEVWCESEITKILEHCHLFVYPGAVGLSIIHAFAIGLPVLIHSDIKFHMPEASAFVDNVNGFSFERGCLKSLTNSLNWAINNKPILADYAVQAYDTVKFSYNSEDMASRFMRFIKEY